jgi:predicted kinase
MLIVFGGLPGVGKTTLAKAVARELDAVYLRVDTIEQALRFSETLHGEVGPAGYLVAYRLAEENLRIGRTVVADSVNPLNMTRDAWLSVAANASKNAIEIEVICSDPYEHRRRVETRKDDIVGLSYPTWQAVLARTYEDWTRPHLVLDTAKKSIGPGVAATEVERVFFALGSGAHALSLLRRRLQGLFGPSFWLEVCSDVGQGTMVTLRIPLQTQLDVRTQSFPTVASKLS